MPWRLIRSHDAPVTWLNKHCVVCFTGPESRDDWIDGGIDVDGEGAYLICVPCARELAGVLGMVTPEAADDLLCRALAAEAQISDALTELAEARTLIEALRRYDAAHAAPVASPEPAVSSSPADSVDDRLARVDEELAIGPVLEHPCPGGPDGQACDRRFTSAAAAGAHAFRKHGRRTAQ